MVANDTVLYQNQAHVCHLKAYPNVPLDYLGFLLANHTIRLWTAKGVEDVPLPDPVFLNIHYTMAEIFHAFGMGPMIDEQLRDIKNIDCLEEYGSTV